MTAAGVGGSRAAAIRAAATNEFTAQSGNAYRLITPGPMHFVKAGFPSVCFLPSLAVKDRLEAQAKTWGEISEDEERGVALAKSLFEQCMVEPRFFAGSIHDCPEDRVCLDYIERDMGEIFGHLLEMAGYGEVKEVAKAADDFREDADGAPGPQGSEALRSPAESTP